MQSYTRVFGAILVEERVLTDLHASLMQPLKASGGTLTKLSGYGAARRQCRGVGESTARKSSSTCARPIQGDWLVAKPASDLLRPAWTTGDSAAV
ncbi:MAG TPA: hypothetical protein VJ813_04875 [Vicinamibacterales bacterium]|nr:hypothetical protein [Vicinamibacterales bacterium]